MRVTSKTADLSYHVLAQDRDSNLINMHVHLFRCPLSLHLPAQMRAQGHDWRVQGQYLGLQGQDRGLWGLDWGLWGHTWGLWGEERGVAAKIVGSGTMVLGAINTKLAPNWGL